MSNFRLLSLIGKSAVYADPTNLQHQFVENVNVKPKILGATDAFINRTECKEVIPRTYVDGSGNTTVNQTVTVSFSGYTDAASIGDLSAAWTRMKTNVDALIADGMLKGFISKDVVLVSGS